MRLFKLSLPIILILLLTTGLLYESLADAPTYDEPANMAAAYDYLYRRDYRLYPDNPPLVKIIAGFFLYPIRRNIKFPNQIPEYNNPAEFNLYAVGSKFLYKTGNDANKIIFLTRLPNILFTLGIGIILYFFAQKLYGEKAGLLALIFYSLDPNIRGHGHILAFDLPVAFFILLSFFLTFLFCKNKKRRLLLGFLLSLTFALGFLTKFTFVFFAFPFFVGMYLITIRHKNILNLKTTLILQITIVIFSFSLLWIFGLASGYNYQSLNYNEVPIIASANKTLSNNFIWNLFGNLPVPYHYKIGLKIMYTHNLVSQPAYLLGEVRAKNDWFFYFPVSFLLKTPIPTLMFILLTLIIIIKKSSTALKTYAPFLFGIFYFLSLMFFSHINNVYRYLFPSLILFILGSSQLAKAPLKIKKVAKAGGASQIPFLMRPFNPMPQNGNEATGPFKNQVLKQILIFLAIFYLLFTSLFSFPYDLSYTNELTGIPPKGYKYLSDSEIDWGQDLKRLAFWLKNNNLDHETITLSYLGTADPEYYGIKYQPLRFEELEELKGIVAISAGNLALGDWMVRSNEYYKLGFIKTAPLDILRNRKPNATIGKSIFVYRF